MKTRFSNIKKYMSLLCVLAMLMNFMPVDALAANITTGHSAQIGEQGIYDVDLSIGGDSESMDTDIVFMPFGSSTVDEVFFAEAIELFMPLITAGSRVRIGVVGMSESGHEIILDLNNDPRAVLPNDEVAIADLLKEIAVDVQTYAGGVNLESALQTAKEMLEADESVPADRKYLFLFNSGMTYFFDNDEGKTSTVPVYAENNVPVWGNLSWMRFRNASVNSNPGYHVPAAYTSWNEYWTDVVNWIEADQDTFVHTVRTTYRNLYNGKTEHKVGSVRYGYTFCEDETPVSAVPNFTPGANPKTNANAAHAFGYDRAMYEAWLVWEQMKQPAGSTITSVLKDENGNNKTFEALGFNCFPIYAGSGASNNIGYQFMNMLAGGNVTIYGADMFDRIASEILHSVSAGSYVENIVGFGEGYDFDFVSDAEKISVDFGGVNYKATVVAENNYAFCNDQDEKLFELIYNPETDSFKFVTYVTTDNTKIANLNYQVELEEVSADAGEYIYLSNSAVLTPVDSENNVGTPVELERPLVINVAAFEPEEDTTEPEEDTTEPEEDTTEPEEDPTEPEEDTTEPEEDPTEPEEDTTEPEEDPAEPEEDPTEPEEDPTEPEEDPSESEDDSDDEDIYVDDEDVPLGDGSENLPNTGDANSMMVAFVGAMAAAAALAVLVLNKKRILAE